MNHSKNFEKVKKYYSMKLWDIQRVKNSVVMNWITEEEYKEITGEEYSK